MRCKGFYFVLGVFLLFLSFSVFISAAKECIEGDDGENYFEKAVCTDAYGGYPEICLGDKTLKEYYCDEDENETTNETYSICEYDTYSCPNGCLDGACLESPVEQPEINDTTEGVNDTTTDVDDVNQTPEGKTENNQETQIKKSWFRRLLDWFKKMF